MSFPFQDPTLDRSTRLDDLLGRLTPAEKIGLMTNDAKAVPRLGIPEYDWWNECLHGVGRAGTATVYPQAIALAATFDPDLVLRVARATALEARAKHHEAQRLGYRRQYQGLTFFSPNVNIFRDPRWGRGQETFGEDPYLTARLGVAFIRGLQGDDEALVVAACVKHFAVHSGPEALRHVFDARVDARDLRETYLPAFEAAVTEARSALVMAAYNRTNGEACCASPTLLGSILRQEWGFLGAVVSDCGAIEDLHRGHLIDATAEDAAAHALRAGCDLECGWTYSALARALEQGKITGGDLDKALRRSQEVLMRLGWYDAPASTHRAHRDPGPLVIDSPAHQALALEAARRSLVLLRNDGLLPLRSGALAVIGPCADNREILLGNYNGTPSRPVTLLEGVRQEAPDGTTVVYAQGCALTASDVVWGERPDQLFAEALAAAARCDFTILFLGMGQGLEGEQGASSQSEWEGDRRSLGLPPIQQRLLDALVEQGRPLVLVLCAGSPLAVDPPRREVPAIVQAWYPGQSGGTALAELLFGAFSPAGRLPVTFPRSVADLPPFVDYAMEGRTYRFAQADPLYPFGFGLGYTTFSYSQLALPVRLEVGKDLTVVAEVSNTGAMTGDEVVQVYLQRLDAPDRVPRCQLVALGRVTLAPGDHANVELNIPASAWRRIDALGVARAEPGQFRLWVGGHQPDARSAALHPSPLVEARIDLVLQGDL